MAPDKKEGGTCSGAEADANGLLDTRRDADCLPAGGCL